MFYVHALKRNPNIYLLLAAQQIVGQSIHSLHAEGQS